MHDEWSKNTATERKGIEEIVTNHFEEIFTASKNTDKLEDMFSGAEIAKLEVEQRKELAKEFTREEVRKVVKEMHPTKALGPDGFQAVFYQKF